jgi:hypothetical protein
MNILTILGNIAGLFKSIIGYFRDKKLIDAGKAEAELEGRKELDAKVTDIKSAINDDSLRNKTRAKYKKP